MPGSEAGQVVTPGSAMRIRAWALEPDRRKLQVGQAVRLSFDALPGRSVDGHISAIAGAHKPRAAWGSGNSSLVAIELPPSTVLPLLPGMTVRCVAPWPPLEIGRASVWERAVPYVKHI